MAKTKVLPLVVAGAMGLLVLAALLWAAQAISASPPLAVNDVVAVQYATGLDEPVDIANTGLLTDTRLFVVERDGRIKVVTTTNGVNGTVLATPFLSITTKVDSESYVEQGLLGLAFSPNYATDGRFYVFYVNNAGNLQLSRFSVSSNPNVANITETLVLSITHNTAQNHNGGDLAFGPDGFLYAAPGDGGNSPQLAQDNNSLLGKVLRINVTGVPRYTIPVTNPYASTTGRDEIWATGLRNPYRFSFDRVTGNMYIGDVGQGKWEEVDFQPAGVGGLNYGWRCYEAHESFNLTDCGPIGNYTMPVAEYCNTNANNCEDGGQAVIGGHVYRGAAYPGLYGYYIYADAYSDNFWALKAGTTQVTELNITNLSSPSGFGENVSGELFVADRSGNRIYRIQGNLVTPVQTPHWLPIFRR